jgi:hypothetical protein
VIAQGEALGIDKKDQNPVGVTCIETTCRLNICRISIQTIRHSTHTGHSREGKNSVKEASRPTNRNLSLKKTGTKKKEKKLDPR